MDYSGSLFLCMDLTSVGGASFMLIALIVFIRLMVTRFTGRYELDHIDPRKLITGNTYYKIYSRTGERRLVSYLE